MRVIRYAIRAAGPVAPLVLTFLAFAAPLDPAGDVDTAGFGKRLTNFGFSAVYAEARAVGVQSTGMTIIGGNTQEGGGVTHFALIRVKTDGTQDLAFGNGGAVRSLLNGYDFMEDLVVLADNKIVVAGWSDTNSNDFVVARYTADGALDTTFNAAGTIPGVNTVDYGGQERSKALAVQTDGKIVLVGECANAGGAQRDICAMRFNANGTIDTSFDTDGKVKYDISGTDRGTGVVIQTVAPNAGKIVLGGAADAQANCGMVRLNSNGSLDTTFGNQAPTNGKVIAASFAGGCWLRQLKIDKADRIIGGGRAGSTSQDMGVVRYSANGIQEFASSFDSPGGSGFDSGFGLELTDGGGLANGTGYKIVVAGLDFGAQVCYQPSGRCLVDDDFLIARWNNNGTPDTSFNNNTSHFRKINFPTTPCPGGQTVNSADWAFRVAVVTHNAQQKIVAVGQRNLVCPTDPGYLGDGNDHYYIAALRLNENGSLDTGFDTDGMFGVQLLGGTRDDASAMALQSDGKAVVVGSVTAPDGIDIGVVRYNTDGTLDSSFGPFPAGNWPPGVGAFPLAAGTMAFGSATAGRNEVPAAVVVRADGKILVGGGAYSAGAPAFIMRLLNANGTPDNAFGAGGLATVSYGTNSSEINAMVIQADGKIVAGGTASSSSGDWFYQLTRWNANGTLDTGFNGTGGVAYNAPNSNHEQIHALALQPDGKIVAAGQQWTGTSTNELFSLLRFTTGGVLDNTFGCPTPGTCSGVATVMIGASPSRDDAKAVRVLHDGKILVVGRSTSNLPTGEVYMAAARFHANGTLDTSYGTGGTRTIALLPSSQDEINAMVLQRDEKALVWGSHFTLSPPGGSFDFAAARLNWDDGSLDTTFGTSAGYTITDMGGGQDFQSGGGAIDASGRGYAAGSNLAGDFSITRFLPDPPPTLPGAPDLDPASDSVSPNTVPVGTNIDNITNDNTPTFTGTCGIGDTVILRIGGSDTAPLSRHLCRTGSYTVTTSVAVAEGPLSFTSIARNGSPSDSAVTAALGIVIDTVATAPTIGAPAQNAIINPRPTISGGGAEVGAYVVVKHNVGGAQICTANANASGNWSCVSALGPGTYAVVATQTDRAGNTSVNSAVRNFTLKAPTTTTLGLNPATQSRWGQSVTMTATVDAGEWNPPTGNVSFDVDGTVTARALTNGVNVWNRTDLAVGNHTLKATYPETTSFFGSGPDTKSFEVLKADTTTGIVVTPQPTVVGQAVTITYTIGVVAPGAGTPTGTVTVSDGTQSCTGAAPSGSCQITYTSTGVRTLNASYPGDGNFNASTTVAGTSHTVNKANTTATITADTPDPSAVGQNVQVSFTLAVNAPGAGTPTGTITVSDGVQSCTAAAAPTGNCTVALTTMGPRTLTATYDGDANFNGNTSVGAAHVVENATPVLNDQALPAVAENSANGTVVGTVVATDPDAGQVLTYAITAGNAGGAFAINPSTGQVTVANAAALDFETTPNFSLTVQVTDNGVPNKSDTGIVTIPLTNVNEAPVIANQARGPIAENSPNGTSVGAVIAASDPDAGQVLSYAITAGNTGGALAIASGTGQITVANTAALDFETTPTFTLTVSVTDNAGTPLTSSATVTVTVSDVNEAPVVAPQTFAVPSNAANGTVVGTVAASDPDPGQTLTYGITGGNTGGAFAINPANGQITVANTAAVVPANGPFSLTVQVTDNGAPTQSTSAAITINILPVTLTISDVTQPEDNTGTSDFVFTVTIAGTVSAPVTVNYTTLEGSALAASDYVATSGTLTFNPGGPAQQNVTVQVNGDGVFENTETFTVELSGASGAGISDASGAGIITNDDGQPVISIGDVKRLEGGDSGTAPASFNVTLSNPSGLPVTVQYDTLNGTAVAGTDFVGATAQTLTFNPGVTTLPLDVLLNGDPFTESTKRFLVHLSNPTGATLAVDVDGEGTIVDDDPAWDPNNDGHADLLWQHTQDPIISSWFLDGPNLIGGQSLIYAGEIESSWRVGVIADFDGDGKSDLVWQYLPDGSLGMWHMDGSTLASSVVMTPSVQANPDWRLRGAGDFDGDGNQDIVVQHPSGPIEVWRMDDNTRLGVLTVTPTFGPNSGWEIAGVIDMNQDQKPDLLLQNVVSGNVAVWFMNGAAAQSSAYLSAQNSDPNWRVVSVADVDRNGSPDLIWRHLVTGDLATWSLDGVTLIGGSYLNPQTVSDQRWVVVGAR